MTILELVTTGFENWDNATTLFECGYELEERSRFDIAEKFLTRSIQLDPSSNPGVYIALAHNMSRGFANRDAEAEQLMKDGMRANSSALQHAWTYAMTLQGTEALDKITELYNLQSDEDLMLSIATASLWSGELTLAERAVQRAHDFIQTSTDAEAIASYVIMMISLHRGGKIDATLHAIPATITQLRKVSPALYSTYSVWIGYCRLTNDWKGALQAALTGLQHMPDEETLMQLAAEFYWQMEDYKNAEKYYLLASGAKHTFIGARLQLARMYDKLGRTDEAIDLVKTFPTVNPNYKWGHILGAAILWKHGHKDDAADIVSGAQSDLPEWAQLSMKNNPTLQEIVAYVQNN